MPATQAEGERRNRLGVRMVVERIQASGQAIDPRATEICPALMSAGVHDSLVSDAGWSHQDYEDWLGQTMVTAVLR